MRKSKDNFAYLHHMRDALLKINSYTKEHNFDYFSEHEWDQDAVMRNLEIIGEAAKNTEDDFKNKIKEIPWRSVINMRNVLVHDYADVDLEIVWQIITVDVPILTKVVDKLL